MVFLAGIAGIIVGIMIAIVYLAIIAPGPNGRD